MALTDKLVAIGDAIRNKTNTTDTMTLDEMPTKIENIVSETNPILQDKSVEITENGTQTITHDEGYDGLNNVELITNVENRPEKGFYIKETDSDGFPTVVELIGFEEVPACMFSSGAYYGAEIGFYKNLHTVILHEGTKTLGDESFCYNNKIIDVIIPNSLETIGQKAFYNCSNLNIKSLCNVTTLKNYCFQSASIVQMSMPKLESVIKKAGYGYAPFGSCSNLKAVWIGENFQGIDDYLFNHLTSALTKVFINQPRAIVETFPGFSFVWTKATTKPTVICNDDEGWMSLEEFDATDWSTYTE